MKSVITVTAACRLKSSESLFFSMSMQKSFHLGKRLISHFFRLLILYMVGVVFSHTRGFLDKHRGIL